MSKLNKDRSKRNVENLVAKHVNEVGAQINISFWSNTQKHIGKISPKHKTDKNKAILIFYQKYNPDTDIHLKSNQY